MVKILLDRIASRTRLGFFLAFFLLLLSYILTYAYNVKVTNQANRANETNKIIRELNNVWTLVVLTENAHRGYLLTMNSTLLNNYKLRFNNIDSALNELKPKINDNAAQIQNLEHLNKLLVSYKRLINELQNKTLAVIEPLSLKKELSDHDEVVVEIEKQIEKMQMVESNIWKARDKEVSEYTGRIKIFNILSIALAILFTMFSFVVYNKENKAKKKETKKAGVFRKQLEKRVQELADLNKELIDLRSLEKYAVTGRIARTIAHEVRNPLTNINLSIEQLKSEVPETETTELFFKMIIRNSERINNLVSDLLNATRVMELKFENSSINDILDDSLSMALDRIELKKIKVIRNYETGMCTISADAKKIQIAFLNIIVNAIEAMEIGGILTLKTITEKDKCVVQISDTGVGMNKDELSKLFEPYFTTKEKGNGLGLANSQNIILGHNGTISATSEPDSGSTFTITLSF